MNKGASRALLSKLPTVITLAVTQFVSAVGAKEENTIVPGNHIGAIKLGMKENKVTAILGKDDGAYSQASGIKVVLYQWNDLDMTSTIKAFFDPGDRVVQLASTAPLSFTADGISLTSSLADVKTKYKAVECRKYKTKNQRIDYYDDVKQGIAFKFTRDAAESSSAKRLSAILVHWPDHAVIPDTGELDL
jgi:hypothetical protein